MKGLINTKLNNKKKKNTWKFQQILSMSVKLAAYAALKIAISIIV